MDNQIFETNQHTGKFSLADFFAHLRISWYGDCSQRCGSLYYFDSIR
jgi:hypothetical protein